MTIPTDKSFISPFNDTYRKFSDPFLLPSSFVMPTDHVSVMDFSLFLFYMNQPFAKATERTVAHFVTDMDFRGKVGGRKERDELKEFYTHQLDVLGFLRTAGLEFSCYGNAFVWIYFPFDRVLIDMRGGKTQEWPMEIFGGDIKFDLTRMRYSVPDPRQTNVPAKLRRRVDLPFRDRKSTDLSRIRLRLLDPRQVTLLFNELSTRTQVIYRFRPDFIRQIRDGVVHQVNDTPYAMLEAMRDDNDYLFNEGAVFHLKLPTISGVSNSGWGMPSPIANFRSLFQMQVYRKIDEALALDYMLPMRIITPKVGNSLNQSDIDLLYGEWSDYIGQVIDDRRADPFSMHSLPFPIEYSESNASGKVLSPKDSIAFAKDEILEGAGYPIEFWKGSMNFQVMPTAMRLFESAFAHYPQGFNRCLRWINESISRYANRERLDIFMKLPTMADDLEARQIYLQLSAAGEISRERALRPFNIEDPVEEVKKRMREDMELEQERAKQEMEMERVMTIGSMNQVLSQTAAGAPTPNPGAQGAGPTPAGAQVTPTDRAEQASTYADQALQMQPGERRRLLDYLRASDPTLHALTKEMIERKKRQAESQGRAQLTAPPQ